MKGLTEKLLEFLVTNHSCLKNKFFEIYALLILYFTLPVMVATFEKLVN